MNECPALIHQKKKKKYKNVHTLCQGIRDDVTLDALPQKTFYENCMLEKIVSMRNLILSSYQGIICGFLRIVYCKITQNYP